ncbi:MAG TPA: zeta toxin [Flavobacteriales bacterium]|nr:zeta toxin [Flavobacteriales bacterium]
MPICYGFGRCRIAQVKALYLESMAYKNLFIIAGCNGAGKTTASFTILPEIIDCKEFINADEIAKGLSPFQPESVAIESGRIMIDRIEELVKGGKSFAFETTLATKGHFRRIQKGQQVGYTRILIFFWLNNVELAKERVKIRVKEGGHAIPDNVIERRYYRGLKNLFSMYLDEVEAIFIFDNSYGKPHLIARKNEGERMEVFEQQTFIQMKRSI